jgi:hypothetical protein
MAAAAVVVVGCSSAKAGGARPAADSSTASSGTNTPSTAPPITHPLDASGLVTKPCAALSPSDLAGLGVTNPIDGADHDANGAGCTWTGDTGGTVGVSWETTNTHGLADLYVKKSTFAYWIPTTIAGYPGVYGDSLGDQRANGDCVVNVGVSDHLAFFAEDNDPDNAPQDCRLSGRVAADVIATLKAGA